MSGGCLGGMWAAVPGRCVLQLPCCKLSLACLPATVFWFLFGITKNLFRKAKICDQRTEGATGVRG